ncbi:MAG TPA: hypothetical protein PL001_01530 [Candidatus Kryptobacter bacterium]|nr:MAG: hypothetical protein B7Z63_00410 [Ignavibacteriae bacterium 37-53-5]HQT90691.1 hypothetical protein [Candidatus Kryptobacter bacterium]
MSKRRSFGPTKSNGEFSHGPWHVEYRLNDGGRLSRLSYRGYDLLTTAPSEFRPPASEHGRFEDRPVYGYDDCFPSVVACLYPGLQIRIPDHGEVCWLAWELSEEPDSLTFFVRSKLFPVVFKRRMLFTDSSIIWTFEVLNEGKDVLPFQHSMHPLVRVDELESVELPEFESVFDWNKNQVLSPMTPGNLADFLLDRPEGAVEMLFVRDVKTGEMSWTYRSGLSLMMKFPAEYFQAIGIWWDNGGYPDEDGIRRSECAFEPTPGRSSLLTQAYADGNCLAVGPGAKFKWQVTWEVKRDLKERTHRAI